MTRRSAPRYIGAQLETDRLKFKDRYITEYRLYYIYVSPDADWGVTPPDREFIGYFRWHWIPKFLGWFKDLRNGYILPDISKRCHRD